MPPPPVPEQGIQLAFGPFETPAGTEQERCAYSTLPDVPWTFCSESKRLCQSDAECGPDESCIALLTGGETFMTPGSHHFLLLAYAGPSGREAFPEGQVDTPFCLDFGPPDVSLNRFELFGAQSPVEGPRRLPDGTGVIVRARQPVLVDTHFVNSLTVPYDGRVWVNLHFAKPEDAGSHRVAEGGNVDLNFGVRVPPHESQTTCKTWSPETPVDFFFLSSHRHSTTYLFTIDFCERVGPSGECLEIGERLYESRIYNDPEILWDRDGLFEVQPDQGLHYCCSITNDGPRKGCTGTLDPGNLGVTVPCKADSDCEGLAGATGSCEEQILQFGFRAVDEMCILVGRYFES